MGTGTSAELGLTVLRGAGVRVALGEALIAELATCRLGVYLIVVGGRPVGAVGAEMPGIRTTLPSVDHDSPPWGDGLGTREVCKLCYHINAVGFRVPNEVWIAVVPSNLREAVICLACFTRLADERLVSWEAGIELFPVSLATYLQWCNQERGEV